MEGLSETVLQAARIGESADWEFKSAKGGFPGSFWPTYSAMANTEGGTIVLGIREIDDHSFKFDGLTLKQINDYKKILWDNLNNRSKTSKNLLMEDDVQVIIVNDQTLLAIHIPRSSYTDRPIYVGPTPLGHTYRRCHEGDYCCSNEEVRRMLADAEPIPSDQKILPNFTLKDIDQESLAQYLRRFAILRPNHPWLNIEPQEFLEKLGGWRRDRSLNQEGVTLAGLLMFGKYESITDGCAAPHYFVDYREKLDQDTRWTHRICPDGTWEANLFQFYQRIWPHLVSDLKVPFHLEGMQRLDETPAHLALREAFVNALVHSDYREAGGIVIERQRDHFVIENPGTLLVSLEQLLRGGVSNCRNPYLQKMFLMIGGGEKAGSGYDRIQSGWRCQHWRPPSLTQQNFPDRVKLRLSMTSLIPDEAMTALQNRFGEDLRGLNEQEVQILVTAHLEGNVSNVRLQEVLTDHPADITQILQRLCSKKMLMSDNRRRWARYQLPSLIFKDGPQLPSLNSPHSRIELPSIGTNFPLSEEELEVLREIAKPIVCKKRASKDLMHEVISRLCIKKYLNAEQLSVILDRDMRNLQERHLATMVAEGVLIMRYPETPNHPEQAYTTRNNEYHT